MNTAKALAFTAGIFLFSHGCSPLKEVTHANRHHDADSTWFDRTESDDTASVDVIREGSEIIKTAAIVITAGLTLYGVYWLVDSATKVRRTVDDLEIKFRPAWPIFLGK